MSARLAALLAAWLMLGTFARAADQVWDACSSGVPDRAIAGCTAVLGRGDQESAEDRAIALYDRGSAYLAMEQYDRAIADLSEAVRLDPTHAEAFNNRGIAHIRKGEYDQAIADLNEAIRLKPGYAKAFLNRGGAHFGKDEHDRAIADLSEAIRLDPGYAKAYQSRSEVHFAEGDHDRGQADHVRAIELEHPPRGSARR